MWNPKYVDKFWEEFDILYNAYCYCNNKSIETDPHTILRYYADYNIQFNIITYAKLKAFSSSVSTMYKNLALAYYKELINLKEENLKFWIENRIDERYHFLHTL